MPGHIALGNVGALRDYMIANTDLYSKAPANQFAAKLATGAGDYDDLQNWSYWVQDNWQMGVGQKDAEASGFLYGETETRYPEQVLLSRHLHLEMQDSLNVYACDASSVTGETTIGSAATKQKWAVRIGGEAGRTLTHIWIYLKNNGETFTVRLSGETSNAPGTSIATDTITTDATTPGYAWYLADGISESITSTAYWISLEVVTSGTLPKVEASHATPTFKYYDGAAWQATTDYFGILLNPVAYGADVPDSDAIVSEFNNELYAAGGGLHKRIGSTPGWDASISGVANPDQLLDVGDILFVIDSNNPSKQMDAAETPVSLGADLSGDDEAAVATKHAGIVWVGFQTDIAYTSDGATWTYVPDISWSGDHITGMAGLNEYVYFSTRRGFSYVGFGDEVIPVSSWGSPSNDNGKGLLHYQGQLFIPLQESLIRFDGSAMLPVGVDLNEGLPSDLQGNVAALASTNNWLLMGVNARNTTTKGGTVWAWTGQGWHHLAHLPPTLSITSLYYRRSDQRLYIGCDSGHVFSLYLPDIAQVVDTVSPEFAPVGWMETDWFFGGLKEVEKDFESVYISGEDMAAGQYVRVYWKDDASTEWELLGTVTSDRQELRWSDYSTRPQSRQLKIGLEMHTTDPTASPLLRAVRVKYHPMVSDWFRWSFPILCSNNQQELGGTISAYNANQKRSHLDTLITQVPPFIFRDMDGVEYEVKVMGCAIQNDDVEWIDGQLVFNSIYNMTIEAIRNGTYTS